MITIALSKGRIETNFYKMLLEKNISKNIIDPKRNLKINIENKYEILLVKSIDVIKLVSEKYANIGIVGSDTIEETNNNNIKELLNLNTGKCTFALASTEKTKLENIKIIATKYPNITKRLIKELEINPKIIKMEGSLELAPLINYADAIVDLVETGNTLKANGLIILKNLEQISTRIITNYENENNEEINEFIKKIKK
jgi:ATP phosphoribosyltransferase